MARRAIAVLAAVATAVGGLAFLGAPAGAVDPALVPLSPTVAVGASVAVNASGCEGAPAQGHSFRMPQVTLLTGSGSAVRRAAVTWGHRSVSVPGWVDPDQPATLVGRCVDVPFDEDLGATTVFDYPPTAIDIVAGPATAPNPVGRIERTTVAGGTVVPVEVSGCFPGGDAGVLLLAGQAPGAGDPFRPIASGHLEGRGDSGRVDLPLLTNERVNAEDEDVEITGRPVPEGEYTVQVLCVSPFLDRRSSTGDELPSAFFSEPVPLVVAGTSPSSSIRVRRSPIAAIVEGDDCTGGRAVRARVVVASESTGDDGPTFVDGRPDGDGSWSVDYPVPAGSFSLQATVDCGDPTAGGFRYSTVTVRQNPVQVYIRRVSPDSSPAGGQVRVDVWGRCRDGATVAFENSDGAASSSAPVVTRGDGEVGVATLSAPAVAGSYRLGIACGGQSGESQVYEVFEPATVAASAPLPSEASAGWPVSGEPETYHGRVGPIVLRDPDEIASLPPNVGSVPADGTLGPSGLLSELARPEGDVAITGLRLRLVDEAGNPVSSADAMLHYFVIGDLSSSNPACPDGTFGLPSDIVAAAGGEGSVVELPTPYGIVAPAAAPWGASYSVGNRTDREQRLYLSYDLDLRRDVENVRPVQRYFGSARGCDTQSWDLDGLGGTDTQSAFVTMRADGRLVGAGTYLRPGAVAAEVVNDRGRRLCRSLPETDGSVLGAEAVQELGSDEGYVPDTYPDDLRILGLGFCPLAESVRAGERLRLDAIYNDDRPRAGVMGIFQLFVWEGGGPAGPGAPNPPPASVRPGRPAYAG